MKLWKIKVTKVVCVAVILGALVMTAHAQDEGGDACDTKAESATTTSPVNTLPAVDLTALRYGDQLFLPREAVYFASADGGGTGTMGCIGSRFAPEEIYLGGFAVLDSRRRLRQFEYVDPTAVVTGQAAPAFFCSAQSDEQRWVHLFEETPTGKADLGWIAAADVIMVRSPGVILTPHPTPDT